MTPKTLEYQVMKQICPLLEIIVIEFIIMNFPSHNRFQFSNLKNFQELYFKPIGIFFKTFGRHMRSAVWNFLNMT